MEGEEERPAGAVPEEGAAEAREAGIVPASEAVEPERRRSPLLMFLGVLLLALLSLGGSALILAGTGRFSGTPEPTQAPVVTSGPARTAAGTGAAPATGRVRVVSSSGRSRPVDNTGRQHEVTFTWVLEGARENDPAVVQFYQGTRSLGQQTGTLDPSVFSFSTGTLTLTAQLECSAGGWSAEILTIRGVILDGDPEVRVTGVSCP